MIPFLDRLGLKPSDIFLAEKCPSLQKEREVASRRLQPLPNPFGAGDVDAGLRLQAPGRFHRQDFSLVMPVGHPLKGIQQTHSFFIDLVQDSFDNGTGFLNNVRKADRRLPGRSLAEAQLVILQDSPPDDAESSPFP